MSFYKEILFYTIYSYFSATLFVFIKPSFYTSLLLFIYCFISTWFLCFECKSEYFKNNFIKIAIISLYSIICVNTYYIIHFYYNTYLGSILIATLPVMYFINVKFWERYFSCDDQFVINKTISSFNDLKRQYKIISI